MISDPRFARLHTDARFQVFPNKQRKVEIDERFKGMPSTAQSLHLDVAGLRRVGKDSIWELSLSGRRCTHR